MQQEGSKIASACSECLLLELVKPIPKSWSGFYFPKMAVACSGCLLLELVKVVPVKLERHLGYPRELEVN